MWKTVQVETIDKDIQREKEYSAKIREDILADFLLLLWLVFQFGSVCNIFGSCLAVMLKNGPFAIPLQCSESTRK